MSRPSRTGLRITTILVSMVVSVVAVILLCCIALFLSRYRNAVVQNARTSSSQAVTQVSNTVANYLDDMNQAMKIVIQALNQSESRRDDLLDAFLSFRPDVGGRDQLRRGRESSQLLGAGPRPQTEHRDQPVLRLQPGRQGADSFMSAPHVKPSLTGITPGW